MRREQQRFCEAELLLPWSRDRPPAFPVGLQRQQNDIMDTVTTLFFFPTPPLPTWFDAKHLVFNLLRRSIRTPIRALNKSDTVLWEKETAVRDEPWCMISRWHVFFFAFSC